MRRREQSHTSYQWSERDGTNRALVPSLAVVCVHVRLLSATNHERARVRRAEYQMTAVASYVFSVASKTPVHVRT